MRHLGRQPVQRDPRNLLAEKYLERVDLPKLGLSTCWSRYAPRPLPGFGNLECGCCVYAALAHLARTAAGADGNPCNITDADVVAAYSAATGYRPGHPETDQGDTMLHGLKRARSDGIGGVRPLAFLQVDHTSARALATAAAVFGGVYCGYDLPLTAQTQARWEYVGGPGSERRSWGGHATANVDRTPFEWGVLSWADLLHSTHNFDRHYLVEAYAVIWPGWLGPDGRCPPGFDGEQLLWDLEEVGRL